MSGKPCAGILRAVRNWVNLRVQLLHGALILVSGKHHMLLPISYDAFLRNNALFLPNSFFLARNVESN